MKGGNESPVQLLIILLSIMMFLMVFEYSYLSGLEWVRTNELLYSELGSYVVPFGEYVRWGFLGLSLWGIMFIEKGGLYDKLFGTSTPVVILSFILFLLGGIAVFWIRHFTLPVFVVLYPVASVTYLLGGLVFFNSVNFSLSLNPDKDKKVELTRCRRKYETELSLNFYSPEYGWFNILNIFRGVTILGNAGSGKTWFWFKPILEWAVRKGFCGLVYDFKAPELIRWVHDSFHNVKVKHASKDDQGKYIGKHTLVNDHRNLWVINFSDLSRTHRVNPIHPKYLTTTTDAGEFAMTILFNLSPDWKHKTDFWAQSAIMYFKAIIWFLKCEYPQQCTLPHAIAMSLMPYEKVLAALKNNQECSQMIEPLAVAERKKAEGQISGQVTSLQAPIQKLNTPELTWVLSENDFFLDLNDPAHPGLLVIGNSPQRSESYGPVLSLISSLVMKLMNDPSKPNKHHSIMALDEAHSLYIPGYESLGPATSRSERVAHIFCSQSKGQVYEMYGEQKGKNILATLSNNIQLATSSPTDAQEASDMIGRKDLDAVQKSLNKSGRKEGYSLSKTRELYYHPEQFRTLQTGKAVGLFAETDDKFDPRFEFRPKHKVLEHNHVFNPFVRSKQEDGTVSYPSNEEILELAVLKHDFIRDQVKNIIEHSATIAVMNGLADETKVFPEHFRGEERIKTALGDPIDEQGFIISRFTGMVIGHRDNRNVYYDTSCIETNPLASYDEIRDPSKYKRKRPKSA